MFKSTITLWQAQAYRDKVVKRRQVTLGTYLGRIYKINYQTIKYTKL